MARRRHGEQFEEELIKPHELAVLRISNVAHELGYKVLERRITPGPGPDLVIRNPKNERTAVVEVELSYASQIQTRSKFGHRWREIKDDESKVLLVFGVSRTLLSTDLSRKPANVPDAVEKIGIRVFSAPGSEETSQIQATLLRCLGDE